MAGRRKIPRLHIDLSFRNPYEAIEQILNPTRIITIGEFLDKYFLWAKENMRPNIYLLEEVQEAMKVAKLLATKM